MPHAYPFADLALARRIERAEGHANAAFVQSRAALDPASGATHIEVGGAYAMFDPSTCPPSGFWRHAAICRPNSPASCTARSV